MQMLARGQVVDVMVIGPKYFTIVTGGGRVEDEVLWIELSRLRQCLNILSILQKKIA